LNPAVNDVGLNKLAGETHLSRYEPSAIAHGNYRCHVNSAIGYKQTVSRYRTPTTFFPDSDQGGSLLDDTNSSWEDRIDAAIESDLTPSSITLPYDIFKPTVSIFESLDLPPIDPAFDLLANISGQGTHSNASNDCQEPYADNQAKHNHRPNDERFDMPNLSLQHPAQTHQALERDCLHLPQNHQDAQHRIKARHAIDIQHVNDMLSDLEVHSK
jgi:hypothetical protein